MPEQRSQYSRLLITDTVLLCMCLLEVLLLLEQHLLLLLSSQDPLARTDWRRGLLPLLQLDSTSLLPRNGIRLKTARPLLSFTLPCPMTQTVHPGGKGWMHLTSTTGLLLWQPHSRLLAVG